MSKIDLFFFVILFVFFVSLRPFHQMSISTEKAKNNTFYDSEHIKNQTSFQNKTEEEEEINEELEGSILDIEGLLEPPKKKATNENSNKTKKLNKTKKNLTKTHKTHDKTNATKHSKSKTSNKTAKNNKTASKHKSSTKANKTNKKSLNTNGANKTKENKTLKNNKIKYVEKNKLHTEFIQPFETELDKQQDQFILLSTQIAQSNEIAKLKVDYAIADQAGSKSDKLLKKPDATPTCYDLHQPYPSPETKEMRNRSILIIILFGTIYLLVRVSISTSKKITDEFVHKSIKMLSEQSILYFILVSLVMVVYTFGLLDAIKINWQLLISALFVFGISWFLFCNFILIFCYFIIKKWKEVESASKNLKNIKDEYDQKANEDYKYGRRNKEAPEALLEYYEYNIFKTYFIIPFYPVFKPSNLRKDFDFALYLSFCLFDRLRIFFKYSWTCWFSSIVVILLWNIFISGASITFITYFMLLVPLIGIMISLFFYFYMKTVYRNVVPEVNKVTYMDFIDIAPFDLGNTRSKIIEYPVYLEKALKDMNEAEDEILVSRYNYNRYFHDRPPSLYEELVFLGPAGFYFIHASMQISGFVMISWSVLILFKYMSAIVAQYGKGMTWVILGIILLYIFIYSFLLSLNLRWYTIISSIEMKRDEKNIKKVLNRQLEMSAEIVEEIYNGFKRLYYDIRLNKKINGELDTILPLELGPTKNTLEKLVDIQIRRFKSIPKKIKKEGTEEYYNPRLENYSISIDEELKLFFKTSGNKMTQAEIQHLTHFLENISEKEIESLTNKEIYDLYFATLYFSNTFPQHIIYYIFEKYFEERQDIETLMDRTEKGLTTAKVGDFMHWYSNYFTSEQINFIKEECSFLEKEFSVDAFTHLLISLRRYHPY